MGHVTVGSENSTPIELYYEDQGIGQPVVLIHGYPLDGHSWERQTRELLAPGYRVITYDRRGFGQSSKVDSGYDYDTFAADLTPCSRPSTCATSSSSASRWAPASSRRYVAPLRPRPRREARLPRLARAVPRRSATTTPTVCRRRSSTASRPRPRPTATPGSPQFYKDFYNLDENLGSRISQEAVDAAAGTSRSAARPVAAYAVVSTWIEDFRGDVEAVRASGKPALIVHGTRTTSCPIDATAPPRSTRPLPEAEYVEVEGAPHGLLWTHADEVNTALRAFPGEQTTGTAQAARRVPGPPGRAPRPRVRRNGEACPRRRPPR